MNVSDPYLLLPDPRRFDPMTEQWWTLPMTAEWIVSRLPDDVRLAWPKYDFELRELNRLPNGKRPESQLRSLHDIVLSTANDSKPRQFAVNGADARDDLWDRLRSGELVATGIPAESEHRRTILAVEWLDLDSFDPDLGWPTDAVGRGFKSLLRFRSVVVPSHDVIRIWPRFEPKSHEQRSPAGKLAATEAVRSKDGVKRRGRKKGAGSFEDLDFPFLEEMALILEQGKAASPQEAARKVAEKAHGGGTLKSKAERLGRRYRKRGASEE
jgi:hypothetical protein